MAVVAATALSHRRMAADRASLQVVPSRRRHMSHKRPAHHSKRGAAGAWNKAILRPLTVGILLTCFGMYSQFVYTWHSVDQELVNWTITPRDDTKAAAAAVRPTTPRKLTYATDHQNVVVDGAAVQQPNSVENKQPKNQQQQQQQPEYPHNAAATATLKDAESKLDARQIKRLKKRFNSSAQNTTAFLLKQTVAELADRRNRFPSVQERVKIYMSNWYLPPCPGNDDGLVHYQYVSKQPEKADQPPDPPTTASDLLFRELPHTHPTPAGEDEGIVRGFRVGHEMESNNKVKARVMHLHRPDIMSLNCLTNKYCMDVNTYYLPALERLDGPVKDDQLLSSTTTVEELPVPLLTQWGDSDFPKAYTREHQDLGELPQVPYVMKFRFIFEGDKAAIHSMTSAKECIPGQRPMYKTVALPVGTKGMHYYQPIVWRLTSWRHYGMMDQIPPVDIPWHEKKDAAIWRGALTGIYREGFSLGMLKEKSHREVCMLMHRCRLVLSYASSPLVDAQLFLGAWGRKDTLVPHEIEGTQMYADKKASYRDLLQYKALIMLEGNDISSGLKWALYSNSVVMAQKPTKTSWAMEELLEPWVHYVPLNDELSDVDEKMQWIIDHDKEAQEIAHRGSLWVQDLLYHPDVEHDDAAIYDEMLRRYRAHFVADPTLSTTLKDKQRQPQPQKQQQ